MKIRYRIRRMWC